MPIQRFKNVLRARIARAAEFKGGPFEPTGVGLARHDGDVYRAMTSDPQFLFPTPPREVSTLSSTSSASATGR